jgi:ABC-type bacteriocin/lantibiotic exporter with double-glycine peptidase domain
MSLTPPFVAQEQSDSCAIACLRMILAHKGIESSEEDLIKKAAMQPGGLDPEELARLARLNGIQAVEQQLEQRELLHVIELQEFPIVFLNLAPIDDVPEGHAVIPIRFSRRYVTILDPLQGKRRVAIRQFEKARQLIGNWVVVCK